VKRNVRPMRTEDEPSGWSDRRRIREALDHYRKAQDHLRQGNWGGYGDELKRMADLLERLEKR